MKYSKIVAALSAASLVLWTFLVPAAPLLATVSVPAGPASLVTSPMSLAASSSPVALFEVNLNQSAGETLSSIMVSVDHNGTTSVASNHFANLAVYKDNGDGLFNPLSDLLAGSTTAVSLDATTTISVTANNALDGGKFFVTLTTSSLWSDSAPGDSIMVTFPADGVVTSANSPTVTAVTTAAINADTTGPSLVSAVAQNTGGTPAKEAGDSVALTFSEPTNKPAISSSTLVGIFSLDNSHSFLDGSGQIQSTGWNVLGTVLTVTLSATTSLPTVAVGDTASVINPSVITDQVGNKATGSRVITGTFGGSITVVGPNSLIVSPILVASSSAPVGLFEVGLNQTSGEMLSAITVVVNKNGGSSVTGGDLASISVYKDNGDGLFNPLSDLLAGSQGVVNIGSSTTVNIVSHNNLDGGKFFVALSTAASWGGQSPADSITVTFPSNGIVLSANSPTVGVVTTASISSSLPANNHRGEPGEENENEKESENHNGGQSEHNAQAGQGEDDDALKPGHNNGNKTENQNGGNEDHGKKDAKGAPKGSDRGVGDNGSNKNSAAENETNRNGHHHNGSRNSNGD